MAEGCAATVEEGSDCWGTDGGCDLCNIEYTNLPTRICYQCGRKSAIVKAFVIGGNDVLQCRYCGEVRKKTVCIAFGV